MANDISNKASPQFGTILRWVSFKSSATLIIASPRHSVNLTCAEDYLTGAQDEEREPFLLSSCPHPRQPVFHHCNIATNPPQSGRSPFQFPLWPRAGSKQGRAKTLCNTFTMKISNRVKAILHRHARARRISRNPHNPYKRVVQICP
jgi:hypothetical protein